MSLAASDFGLWFVDRLVAGLLYRTWDLAKSSGVGGDVASFFIHLFFFGICFFSPPETFVFTFLTSQRSDMLLLGEKLKQHHSSPKKTSNVILQSSLGKLQFVDFRVEKKIELESGYIALRKRPHLQSASRSVGQPVSKSRSKMVHLPHPFCRFFCCFSCKCSVSSGFMVNLCNLCGVLCKLKAPLLCYFFVFCICSHSRK